MTLANELSAISAQNDKEVVISVINQVIHRSGTPTSADLNAKLRELQNKACNVEEQPSAELDVKDLGGSKHKNYIPDLRVRKSVAQTMVLKPKNTRLPPTTSVSPGPQSHADMRTSMGGPAFTLSSRYEHLETASEQSIGPGAYNVDSRVIALQSTKGSAAKEISIKYAEQPWHSFGPGPGKYDASVSDSAVSNGKMQRYVRLHNGREERFMNFCPVNEKEQRPGPQAYRPESVNPRVSAQTFPHDGLEERRNIYGRSATERCPDSYCYDINLFSRKLFPEEERSLRRSELRTGDM